MKEDTREFYDDDVVTRLIQFSLLWALVAMFVGVYLSA